MKSWTLIPIIVIFMISANSLLAQTQEFEEVQRLAQSSMTFLDIEVGARAVGMGGAYTTMDNDVTALFGNPAGIAKIKGGAVNLSNCQWIADINQYAFAAAYGAGKLGTFGVSFVMYDNGDLERAIPSRDTESYPDGYYLDGTYTVNQWVGGISYARQITDKFSIGGQLKYCYEDFGAMDIEEPLWDETAGEFTYPLVEGSENNKGVMALDFGTLYYFGFKDLRIGMSLRNFAQSVTYAFRSFNLPVTYQLAIAMNVLSLIPGMDSHDLQVSLTTVSPYDGGERIHIGTEYTLANILSVRAGYRPDLDTGALTAGFGLSPHAFGINLMFDYAYSSADVAFGSINRFSLGFAF